MKYTLNKTNELHASVSVAEGVRKFWPFLRSEKKRLVIAMVAIVVNSFLNLLGPFLVGRAIDLYIQSKDYGGIMRTAGILIAVYACAFVGNYVQTKTMGTVGQQLLFNLRNTIFTKLQKLPVAFFNQNKVGDLISRINNDTDKLNQFFSQSLMQFIGSFFTIIGSAIFMVTINFRLGLAALIPVAGIIIFTQLISGWVKRQNSSSLEANGDMSAEISESLENFKVVVAFNRRDYFSKKFKKVNTTNFVTSIQAGIANNVFNPVYGFASNIAQIIVLGYGVSLVLSGQFTLGLLISFFTYLSRLYDPIKQLANVWSTFQVALAGWDRISEILKLESDMKVLESSDTKKKFTSLLEFDNVSFGYEDSLVLKNISFALERGKTYALVGPTGGGKTTTASLMARLYDPTEGTVRLDGKDIRTYTEKERTAKIGFILQEPFLFYGTVRDNLVYGHPEYSDLSNEKLLEILQDYNFTPLLERFPQGLATEISNSGEGISLGQRQLLAFIRAALRRPEILILDEATANVDTVTEQVLEDILAKLPKETTKVIIAHRLNTIENADEIYFVNAGEITKAGSLKHAMEMLMSKKKDS